MPVRDTTAWRHAIIEKKVINFDEGGDGHVTSSGTHYVICAYSYCENDGLEMYKVRTNTAKPGYEPRYMDYVFCRESHKEKWLDEVRKAKHNAEL